MLLSHAVHRFGSRAFAADDIAAQLTLGDLQQLTEDGDVPVVLHHSHCLGKSRVVGGHVQEFLGGQHIFVAGIAAQQRPFALGIFLGKPADERLGCFLAICVGVGDDADALATQSRPAQTAGAGGVRFWVSSESISMPSTILACASTFEGIGIGIEFNAF